MKIPVLVLILDLIGLLLIALGLFELFSSSSILPPFAQFRGSSLVLLLIGALMVVPMIVVMVRQIALRNRDQKRS